MTTAHPNDTAVCAVTTAEQLAAIDTVESLIACTPHLHPNYDNMRAGLSWLRRDIDQRERHRALGEAFAARWQGVGRVDSIALGSTICAAVADIGATLTLPGDGQFVPARGATDG